MSSLTPSQFCDCFFKFTTGYPIYFGPDLDDGEAEAIITFPLEGWLGRMGPIDPIHEPVGVIRCRVTPQLDYIPQALQIHPYLLKGAEVLRGEFRRVAGVDIKITFTSTILEAICADLGKVQLFYSCVPGGSVQINRKGCRGRDDIKNQLAIIDFALQDDGVVSVKSIMAVSEQPETERLRQISKLIGIKIGENTKGWLQQLRDLPH